MTQDTTDRTRPSIPWAGKLVDMRHAEEELSRLWHLSADNMRISQNLHVRTSVLNFVICAPDVASAYKASTLLRELSSTHIARVTLLILDTSNDSPSTVTTWVTLRSFPIISDIMRHTFEQITVLVTGKAVHSAANIIQPLLKPDLPIYLWWLYDPITENELFHRLASTSNRVIVDSNSFTRPAESIGTLATFLQEFPNCAVSDLNWGRITPWRQLVAQFFDVAEFKPYLPGIQHIEVEHAVAPLSEQGMNEQGDVSPNPTRAWLLVAWLKTRLNWLLESSAGQDPSGTYTWHTIRTTGPLQTRSNGPITGRTGKLGRSEQGRIVIRPRVQSDLHPGTLCLIRLTSSVDNKQAIFTIDREGDADHVVTQVELPQATRPQRTVSMATVHVVNKLLHEELEILGHDHLYEDTLQEMYTLLAE